MVFINGTLKGLNLTIPIGGHCPPNSIFGANLEWKNAQKNEKKSITSEVINNTMPHRNPVSTIKVCKP
jgi:hypothetical protein